MKSFPKTRQRQQRQSSRVSNLLLGITLGLVQLHPLGEVGLQAQPSPQTSRPGPNRCEQALGAAQTKLYQVGQLDSLKTTLVQTGDRYPDHPPARPQGYEFLMVGRGGYTILADVPLMRAISQAILANCPTVSLVSFLAHPEGVGTFGLVNNQVQLFDCYEAYDLRLSPNSKPPWGYDSCL